MDLLAQTQLGNGQTVGIRVATASDVEFVIGWLHDRRVNQWHGGVDEDNPEGWREEWVDQWCRKGIIEYEGESVGYIQWYPTDIEINVTYRIPDGPNYWGIDVFLGVPELFGHGIGTAAVRLLSNHMLAEGIADIVVIDPHQRNSRAIRSYEKAGFVISHVLPKHEKSDGEWHDAILLVKSGVT
jgi:aminoglycoside 6'-N-acetyltransferase